MSMDMQIESLIYSIILLINNILKYLLFSSIMDVNTVFKKIYQMNIASIYSIGDGSIENKLLKLNYDIIISKNEEMTHSLYKPWALMTYELENIYNYIINCNEINILTIENVTSIKLFLTILSIRNLLLINPIKYNFTNETLNFIESYCQYELFEYYLSCGDHLRLTKLLYKEYKINLDDAFIIEGAQAKTNMGTTHIIDVVKFNVDRLKKNYEQLDYSSINHTIPIELYDYEYIFIYSKLKYYLINEDNEYLKKTKINAICKFMLNYKEKDIRPFYIEYGLLNERELINLQSVHSFVPIINIILGDLIYTKGIILMKQYDWENAFNNCFIFYNCYEERINCLIKMKNNNQVLIEIVHYIQVIIYQDINELLPIYNIDENHLYYILSTYNYSNIKQKMLISTLIIKLGTIYSNITFYDLAFAIYPDFKPLKIKAQFLYTCQNFLECAITYEKLLKLNPELLDINFNYGCCLIKLDRYNDAAKIFKKLRDEDRMNIDIVKNLAYCYYKLNDIEKTLNFLKTIARQDLDSFKKFYMISLKNNMKNNIIWALKYIKLDNIILESIHYMIQINFISKDEILEILQTNPHYDSTIFLL